MLLTSFTVVFVLCPLFILETSCSGIKCIRGYYRCYGIFNLPNLLKINFNHNALFTNVHESRQSGVNVDVDMSGYKLPQKKGDQGWPSWKQNYFG